MNELLDKLLYDYSIFNNDIAYYNNLISIYSNDLKKIREYILNDIKNSWNNYKIDWFIDFANNNDFDSVLLLIKKYKLELNPIIVQNIVDKCPKIDEHLNQMLSSKEMWTDDDIELKFTDNTMFDLVYNYAIIHNRIDLGKTITKYTREINYDAYIGDSTKIYIKEIQSLQSFDKNYERIVSYNEYKKLAKSTNNSELAKKYELEALKLQKLIIEGNLCLAIPTASKYCNRGVDFLDLMQEGSLGIMQALERYDPKRSFTFSTYAIWWIKQAITRYIMNNGRTIRIPVGLYTEYGRIKIVQDEFIKYNYREPSIKEIAIKLDWPESKVKHIIKSFNIPISLDSPIKNPDNDESNELYDFVADDVDYEEEIYKLELVKKTLTGLKPREEFVIRMRFGLSNGIDPRFESEHTLEEVGAELNLTRERIRQIEEKVIRRVREKENIKVKYYSNKKNCHFWDFFEGINRSVIYEKMGYLSDDDLEILYIKYDNDLNGYNDCNHSISNRTFSVINKIRKMLNNPNYHPKYYNNTSKKVEEKIVYRYGNEPLVDLLNLDKDVIIRKLNEDSYSFKLLKLVFSEDLNNQPRLDIIGVEDIILLNNIINNLLNLRINETNLQSFMELLKCNNEELQLLVQLISSNNKYQKVYDFFGENLDKELDFYLLSASDYSLWLNIYNNLTNALTKMRNSQQYDSMQIICNKIGKNEEEVNKLLANMNKNSKIYRIIYKYLNNELLNYTEKSRLEHWFSEVKKRDVNKKYTKDGIDFDILLKLLHINEQEFYIIYNTMNNQTKIYEILTNVINNELLSDDDMYIVKHWITLKVRNNNTNTLKILPNTDSAQKLLDDLRITSDELINNLSNIRPESKKYQAIIRHLNGEDLDSKERSAFFNWKGQIKKIYMPNIEILTSSDHEIVKTNLNIALFRKLIQDLDEQTLKIMELRLGLYDGTIYSIREISEILNISEDMVNEYIKKGFAIIHNSIDKNQEDNNTRKLVKK